MVSGPQPALETQPSDVVQTPRKLRLVELTLVIFFATFSPYLSTIYTIIHNYSRPPGDWNYRLVHLICYELSALALVTYVLYRRGSSWRAIGVRPLFSDFLVGLGIFVVGILLTRMMGVAYYSAYHFWVGEAPHFRDVGSMMQPHLSALWIIFVIVNGFYEEGIVRAFVMADLVSITRLKWFAVVFSVLLQAGYHLYQGPSNVILLLPGFLFFAVYFAKTGRGFPLILAHIFIDLCVLAYYH